MEKNIKKKIFFILKGGISLALLGFLLSRSELESLKEEFRKIEAVYFLSAMGLYLFSIVISSFRWKLLVGPNIPVRRLMSFYLIGGFFNNFLPTMVGGDAVKAYYLYRQTKEGAGSLASVFMDRYVGFVGLLIVVSVAYVSGWQRIRETPVVWFIPAIVAGFGLGSIVLWRYQWKLLRYVGKLYDSLMVYKGMKGPLLWAVVYSVVIQFLAIVAVQVIARGMDIRIPWFFFYIFVPLTVVITMIPISVSGFGVREGAMVYMFGFAGVEAHSALGLSLVWYGSVMAANLLGGLEYVRLGHVEKRDVGNIVNDNAGDVPRGTEEEEFHERR